MSDCIAWRLLAKNRLSDSVAPCQTLFGRTRLGRFTVRRKTITALTESQVIRLRTALRTGGPTFRIGQHWPRDGAVMYSLYHYICWKQK